ncbi:MAG: indolepyruvate oxidoreductase subunit beta family protein [Burkholderiales bacterium]
MNSLPQRPITLLVAALGGEGGGVLADWIVAAANAEDFPVQSTSIPGVAQRTGATTYYLEIYPARRNALGGREPVLALTPAPGNVDVMIASELVEAGRAMQNGFISPERTALIASTSRVYTTAEKMAMGDGRADSERIVAAARELAKRAILFDMAEATASAGTVISAVMFGALAGCGALPLARAACETAIRGSGKGIEASLRGFEAGYRHASGETQTAPGAEAKRWRNAPAELAERIRREFPAAAQRIVEEGAARLAEYQDAAYATLYLDRLKPIAALGHERLVSETARFLALWMCYEDIIRVADVKTRRSRFERVRAEVQAKPGEPVHIVEFLKPGVEEAAALLPRGLSRLLLRLANGRSFNFGMRVKTSSVSGFLLMRSLAWLRPLRRLTSRYGEEQALIGRWLAAIAHAGKTDPGLALEIAQLGRLNKGYGETHRRGRDNFLRIMDTLVEAGTVRDAQVLKLTVRAAREAALADPEGKTLDGSLQKIGVTPRPVKPQPIRFTRRKPGERPVA